MDFKSIFDVKQLDDFQLGHLEFVLNSPSYEAVFAPYLRQRRDNLNALLLDPSRQRQDVYNDDFLRGGIVTIDGLLTLFTQLIEETRMERINRTQIEFTPEQQYEEARKRGLLKPIVGLNLPAEPAEINPAEDY